MRTQYTRIAFIATLLSSTMFSCVESKAEQSDKIPGKQENKTHTEAASENKYGGTYAFGDDVEKGAIGEIMIYPLTKSSALFYINVNRGAPSYNMGMLSGEIIIEDGVGIYESKEENLDCNLTFKFLGNELEVSTQEGKDNCGFGHAVYADHSYKRTNTAIPQYYFSGEGDTTYFRSLVEN